MNKEIIYRKIEQARSQKLVTNCYSLDVVEKCIQIWSKDNEFVFAYDDHGIKRIIFFAKTWNDVNHLLKLIDGGRFFLEFLTKEPLIFVPENAIAIASMLRMVNPDCRDVLKTDSGVIKYKNSAKIMEADVQDTNEINRLLWSIFKPEISHLLSDDELRQKILKGEITIHRDDKNHVDAILQANVMPKKFYINQIYNNADKNVIHAILLHRLEKYINNGGKYLYSWVENSNIASIKFHEKYNMKHDGMWSMIYCLERM